MPYIKPYKREQLDADIDALARTIDFMSLDEEKDGNLNYAITRLIDQLYGRRYTQMNEAMGVLECVKQEYYRRVAAPYEDIKAKENGDVYKA